MKKTGFTLDAHQARNELLIERILGAGLRLSDEVDVEFHFWSESSESATRLAAALEKEGYPLLRISDTEEKAYRWNVEVSARMPLQDVISDQVVGKLISIASKTNSVFDGWGTSVPGNP